MKAALALLTLIAVTLHCAEPRSGVDVILHGGTLIDGTGAAPRLADLAIESGIVRRVGDLRGLRGKREIDATGLVIAPGFVDMHGHGDLVLLADNELQWRRGDTVLLGH